MKVVLSESLSYCIGVRKTIELVKHLLADGRQRAYYMLGDVVHNEHVIRDLQSRGLNVVRSIADVPSDGIVILQSHGSPRERYRELEARHLEYVDATCPMVKVIHRRIRRLSAAGMTPVVIGQRNHEEVVGIAGQVDGAIVVGDTNEVTPERFAGVARAGVVVQSTFIRAEAGLILERIRALVPEVVFHDTICRPTSTRQREVVEKSRRADCAIIIGSKSSANTLHLAMLARQANRRAHLIDDPAAVDRISIPPGATVFVASGASTPEKLIHEVVRRLHARDAAGAAVAKQA